MVCPLCGFPPNLLFFEILGDFSVRGDKEIKNSLNSICYCTTPSIICAYMCVHVFVCAHVYRLPPETLILTSYKLDAGGVKEKLPQTN